MMSPIFALKALVALAPVVCARYVESNVTIPSLLDATADELAAGLDAKLFTSVDLVDVGACG